VEVHGAQWSESNERAVALSQSVGGKLVHPFEDEDTWTGHATVRLVRWWGFEVARLWS